MKSKEELLLDEWQKRLGLSDWVIILRYNSDGSDMEEDNAGETEWQDVSKTAVIRIVSKEQYGERIIKYDFERILVHELLHVKFQYFQLCNTTYESKVFDIAQHQLIEDLAQSLVMAKRGEVDRSKNIDCTKVKKAQEKENTQINSLEREERENFINNFLLQCKEGKDINEKKMD